MFSRTIAAVVVVVALGGAASSLHAQTQPANPGLALGLPPKPNNKDDVIQMAEWDFLYGSEKDQEEGLAYLQQMHREQLNPYMAQWRDEKWRDYVSGTLHRTLERAFAAKRYDLCDRAAAHGTIIAATQLPWVEKFLEMRVQAKLKQDKAAEALPLARSYYNVCSLTRTSAAIDLVSMCMIEDHTSPNPTAAARKFRMQQVKGATAPAAASASDATSAAAKEKSVLDDLKVDGAAYEKAARELEARGDNYLRLIERGNLLLLANQPTAAKALFNKAYAVASDAQLAEATESVARAMRAEDGTVGRANAWILSLRPQAEQK
jgi:hypothetical protein